MCFYIHVKQGEDKVEAQNSSLDFLSDTCHTKQSLIT